MRYLVSDHEAHDGIATLSSSSITTVEKTLAVATHEIAYESGSSVNSWINHSGPLVRINIDTAAKTTKANVIRARELRHLSCPFLLADIT